MRNFTRVYHTCNDFFPIIPFILYPIPNIRPPIIDNLRPIAPLPRCHKKSGRYRAVRIGGFVSSFLPAHSGVPLRSVFFHCYFCLSISNLKPLCQSTKIIKYYRYDMVIWCNILHPIIHYKESDNHRVILEHEIVVYEQFQRQPQQMHILLYSPALSAIVGVEQSSF